MRIALAKPLTYDAHVIKYIKTPTQSAVATVAGLFSEGMSLYLSKPI